MLQIRCASARHQGPNETFQCGFIAQTAFPGMSAGDRLLPVLSFGVDSSVLDLEHSADPGFASTQVSFIALPKIRDELNDGAIGKVMDRFNLEDQPRKAVRESLRVLHAGVHPNALLAVSAGIGVFAV
jgi:hypothetical protein